MGKRRELQKEIIMILTISTYMIERSIFTNMTSFMHSILLPICRPCGTGTLNFYQHDVPAGLEPSLSRSFYQYVVPAGLEPSISTNMPSLRDWNHSAPDCFVNMPYFMHCILLPI